MSHPSVVSNPVPFFCGVGPTSLRFFSPSSSLLPLSGPVPPSLSCRSLSFSPVGLRPLLFRGKNISQRHAKPPVFRGVRLPHPARQENIGGPVGGEQMRTSQKNGFATRSAGVQGCVKCPHASIRPNQVGGGLSYWTHVRRLCPRWPNEPRDRHRECSAGQCQGFDALPHAPTRPNWCVGGFYEA